MNDNKLIAEFMKLPVKEGYYVNDYEVMSYFPQLEYSRKLDELEFHSSWDWLMEVVEKIEDFHTIGDKNIEFQLVSYEDEVKIIAKHIDKEWETIVEKSADGNGKKNNIFKAVVEFIKWYNQQK